MLVFVIYRFLVLEIKCIRNGFYHLIPFKYEISLLLKACDTYLSPSIFLTRARSAIRALGEYLLQGIHIYILKLSVISHVQKKSVFTSTFTIKALWSEKKPIDIPFLTIGQSPLSPSSTGTLAPASVSLFPALCSRRTSARSGSGRADRNTARSAGRDPGDEKTEFNP